MPGTGPAALPPAQQQCQRLLDQQLPPLRKRHLRTQVGRCISSRPSARSGALPVHNKLALPSTPRTLASWPPSPGPLTGCGRHLRSSALHQNVRQPPPRLCKCGQRALCLCAAVAQGIDAVHRLPVAVLLCILLILPHRHLKAEGQAAYSCDASLQLWHMGKAKRRAKTHLSRAACHSFNRNLTAAHLLHGLRAWPLLAICPHVAIWPQFGRHQHLCGGITQENSTIHTRTTAASQPCPLQSSRWPTA